MLEMKGLNLLDIFDLVVKFATLIAIIGGGGITLFRLGRMTQKFEQIGEHQAKEISELKVGVQKVEGVLIALANQSGRIDRVEDRVALQGQRIDTLTARHNSLVDRGILKPVDPIERA